MWSLFGREGLWPIGAAFGCGKARETCSNSPKQTPTQVLCISSTPFLKRISHFWSILSLLSLSFPASFNFCFLVQTCRPKSLPFQLPGLSSLRVQFKFWYTGSWWEVRGFSSNCLGEKAHANWCDVARWDWDKSHLSESSSMGWWARRNWRT